MNKSVFLALTIAVSLNVSAQKSNVQNAYKSLKKDKIPEAIEYIEQVSEVDCYSLSFYRIFFLSSRVLISNISGKTEFLVYFSVSNDPMSLPIEWYLMKVSILLK